MTDPSDSQAWPYSQLWPCSALMFSKDGTRLCHYRHGHEGPHEGQTDSFGPPEPSTWFADVLHEA